MLVFDLRLCNNWIFHVKLLITDLTTTDIFLLHFFLIISVERSLIHRRIPTRTNLMTNNPAVFHLQKKERTKKKHIEFSNYLQFTQLLTVEL